MPWLPYTVRAFWYANLPDRMPQMPMFAGKYPSNVPIPSPYQHSACHTGEKVF